MEYAEFLKELNKKVANLSVPCEIRNFGDWQPVLYIRFSDMGTDEQVIKKFIKEYNDMNDTIYGNLSDLTRKEYLQGKVPSGCCFYPVPKSEEYTALRNRLLSIAEEVKKCGFDIRGSIGNARHRDEICFSIWNDDIEKERSCQYRFHEADSERERMEEKRQERAFENMISY